MYYTTPRHQTFNLIGVSHIEASDAYALSMAGKAVIVDLREEEELAEEGAPDTTDLISFPLSKARFWPYADETRLTIVMCAHGIRSVRVCHVLVQQGLSKVVSLDGGFEQWKLDGLPVKLLG